MARQTDYFKLGLFIILGSVLILFTIAALMKDNIFKTPVVMETYLNESVNGLSLGSPVVFRGVKIGSVSRIGFVTDKYADFLSSDLRYVLVEAKLDGLADKSRETLEKGLQRDIARGLRVRPVSQGVTGQIRLSIDYVDPESNPPLQINWEPEHLYIPSAPSTLSQIEAAISSVSETMRALNKDDLEAIIRDVRMITGKISGFVESKDGVALGKLLIKNLDETQRLLASVNKTLDTPEAMHIVPDVGRTVAGVRRIVESSGDDVIGAAGDLRAMAVNLRSASAGLNEFMSDPAVRDALTKTPGTLDNLNTSAAELAATMRRLGGLVDRVETLVAGQQSNIEATLEGLRATVKNFEELSGEAKRYPSGVLFGDPPKQVKPVNDE